MKKMNKRFSALAIAALLLAGSISVGAASAYKEVTARQNTGMQVKSGDIELTLKDDNGNTLYPLTYNNVVYLPAEQLADLLGYDTTVTTNSILLEPKSSSSTGDIGAGKAKSIALNHAGISASQAVFVKVDKEYDDGRLHYDVEFYSGNKEYDYEIAAKDGSILSVDMDIENYSIPSVDTSDSSKNYIGIENAKQTALSKAGLSSSSVHWEKAELDYDDGRAEYELEFHSGPREYECAVDAISGNVLSFERD